MKKITLPFLLALSVTGCVTPGGMSGMGNYGIDAQKMDAAQIKEAVALLKAGKEKDSQGTCYRIPTPWGPAVMVDGSTDTAGRLRGKLTMTADCTMTIEHDSTPPAAPGTTVTTTTTVPAK